MKKIKGESVALSSSRAIFYQHIEKEEKGEEEIDGLQWHNKGFFNVIVDEAILNLL